MHWTIKVRRWRQRSLVETFRLLGPSISPLEDLIFFVSTLKNSNVVFFGESVIVVPILPLYKKTQQPEVTI